MRKYLKMYYQICWIFVDKTGISCSEADEYRQFCGCRNNWQNFISIPE